MKRLEYHLLLNVSASRGHHESKYELEEITTLHGLKLQYYHAVTARRFLRNLCSQFPHTQISFLKI
jgi:hypothetical protein